MNKIGLIGKLIIWGVLFVLLVGAGTYYKLGKKEAGTNTGKVIVDLNISALEDAVKEHIENDRNATNESEIVVNGSDLNYTNRENISLNYTALS